MKPRLIWLLLGLLVPASAAMAQRPSRFEAKLRDGSMITGDALANWHAADAMPTLDGRPLLEHDNPLVWLRDRQLTPGDPPAAFVELFSGDCLPGIAVEYRESPSAVPEQQSPHWVVRPTFVWRGPRSPDELSVRVRARFVRRIVWQRRTASQYRPGTAFLRDGSSIPFRAVRFDGQQASLLAQDAVRRVALAEMAELHFPQRDFWEDYLDELAVLGPDPHARLLQLETDDGLIATTALDRLTVFAWGGAEQWQNWAHGVQPAWALDVLYVPCAHVAVRRLFVPTDVLLSRVSPTGVGQTASATIATWPPQLNRNVLGQRLHSGGREFGWGFGVHAPSQLRFPLTPLGVALRTELGLDRIVGPGGCIQGIIRVGDPASPPLFQSRVLVGSADTQNAGRLGLPAASEIERTLSLVVDPAHDQRPPGADPLDIRDCADWLEPVLELDPDRLRAEIRRRVLREMPALGDWQATFASDASWPSVFRELQGRSPAFLRATCAGAQPLRLGRRLKLDERDQWLLVSVSQSRTAKDAPRVHVLMDGEPALDDALPYSDKWRAEVNPLVVSLKDYVAAGARDVQLEILQPPDDQNTATLWQGIVTGERLPMVCELFEDEGLFVAQLAERVGDSPRSDPPPGPAPAELVTADRYAGDKAVRLAIGPHYHLKLPRPLAIREQPAWGEFRLLRFAFRKQGGGRISVQLTHAQADRRPAWYDAGTGAPALPLARRAYDRELRDEWTVVTRDVYADFGELDIDGITLAAPDGQGALFDQIYLARTWDDFRFLPLPSPVFSAADHEAATTGVQPRVSPATVTIDFGGGHVAAGTLVGRNGDILTTGSPIAAPNRPVQVTLADGRTVAGQTGGVFREAGVGMVKIAGEEAYPGIDVENFTRLDERTFYCAAGLSLRDRQAASAVTIANVRRLVGAQLWTDAVVPGGTYGGGLFTRWGRLVGVHAAASRFGGAVYGVLPEASKILDRLRAGEVWGRWLRAAAPTIGARLVISPEGLAVQSVAARSPAARTGLQPGDVVRQIDGRAVRLPDELYEATAEKMTGETVRIDYRRAAERRTADVALAPVTAADRD